MATESRSHGSLSGLRLVPNVRCRLTREIAARCRPRAYFAEVNSEMQKTLDKYINCQSGHWLRVKGLKKGCTLSCCRLQGLSLRRLLYKIVNAQKLIRRLDFTLLMVIPFGFDKYEHGNPVLPLFVCKGVCSAGRQMSRTLSVTAISLMTRGHRTVSSRLVSAERCLYFLVTALLLTTA